MALTTPLVLSHCFKNQQELIEKLYFGHDFLHLNNGNSEIAQCLNSDNCKTNIKGRIMINCSEYLVIPTKYLLYWACFNCFLLILSFAIAFFEYCDFYIFGNYRKSLGQYPDIHNSQLLSNYKIIIL